MNKEKWQFIFLIALLSAIFIIAGLIFRPFFDALIMAAVFSVIFRPLYKKLMSWSGNRAGLSALFTAIFVIVIVVVPLLFLGSRIFQEARSLYSSLADNSGKNDILNTLKIMDNNLEKLFPTFQGFSIDINQYLRETLGLVVQNLGSVFSSFAKIITSSFIFLIALYYLLKDGAKLKRAMVILSPLNDADDETIFNKLKLAVNSVVKGSLAIACIQGVVAAAGFGFFGVPNPILWGTVAAVAALIPGIGTALVLVPAIAFLFLSGQILPGSGLLVWSVSAVGLIDNFLGPKIVGQGTKLHPLIAFIAVLGGIMFFGPLGFILGPLVIMLLFALLDIYSQALENH